MDKLTLENVKLIFKNFRGEERQFNAIGDRNFSIVIDDLEYGESLRKEGWAVRPLTNRDTDEQEAWHLPVKVNFEGIPPRVIKVSPSSGKQTMLSESTVDILDFTPIQFCDVTVNPYEWSVQGNSGVKAYLSVIYAVVDEDELDLKWQTFEAEGGVHTADELGV
jgi:hypothetical protein